MLNLRLSSGIHFAFVLMLVEFTSACLFHKSPPQAFTPPPPQVEKPAPPVQTPTLPAPPEIAGDPNATVPPETPVAVPEAPAPPAPKPPARRAVVPPRAVTPPAQADQTPPPRLGPMLTPDQLRDYNRTLDESLDRVKKILAALSRKNLNSEQADTANRISTFQKQAEQERELDLVTAVNLAKRADLLAQDLMERVP
jgi:hypothetical protein